jgi:exoribonuclease R
LCSLAEGRKRLTKSVFIRFDAQGEPIQVDLANAYIKSAKRLTYEQASAALEGKADGLPGPIAALLARMDRLARILLARREADRYAAWAAVQALVPSADDRALLGETP